MTSTVVKRYAGAGRRGGANWRVATKQTNVNIGIRGASIGAIREFIIIPVILLTVTPNYGKPRTGLARRTSSGATFRAFGSDTRQGRSSATVQNVLLTDDMARQP